MIKGWQIPKTWCWSTIAGIASSQKNAVVDGPFGSNLKTSDYVEDGIPVLQGKNITNNEFKWFDIRFISEQKAVELSRSSVQIGDILIIKIGSIGYAAELNNLKHYPFAIIPANLAKLTIDKNIADKKYVLHWLATKSVKRHFDQIASKTAQPALSLGKIKELPIPLPPLAEQKRIAAILDKADNLRHKNQQAIQLADQFLRAVFLDMFGDPVTNPKGWDIVKVGSIVDCIVPGRDKPKSFTGNIPWVTTNDLCHLGFTYEPKKFLGLTDFEIKEVKAKIVPKGSVLMTCVGDLGVVSVSGKDIVINQQLHAFLPSPKLNNMFLMYALSLQKNFMLNMASNTTVPYMNKTICNSVPLIIPPVNDQNRFGEIYEKAQEKLIKTEKSETKSDELFSSLSQKAFAGEL